MHGGAWGMGNGDYRSVIPFPTLHADCYINFMYVAAVPMVYSYRKYIYPYKRKL